MLAKEVTNPDQPVLGALDIRIRRNAYGRQVDSSSAPASSANRRWKWSSSAPPRLST